MKLAVPDREELAICGRAKPAKVDTDAARTKDIDRH
jgi:hypothetical protein